MKKKTKAQKKANNPAQTSHGAASDKNSLPFSASGEKANPDDFSNEEIKEISDYVMACICQYKTREETASILWQTGRIDPEETYSLWEYLEGEIPEFFRAHRIMLILKKQIMIFNDLLAKQQKLMEEYTYSRLKNSPPADGVAQLANQRQPKEFICRR